MTPRVHCPKAKRSSPLTPFLAAEGQRQQRVILVQEVDREGAFLADARVRAGVAVDADDQRGRIVRQRAGRCHRQPGALAVLGADRDQRDGAGALAHRLLEILCVDAHAEISEMKCGCGTIAPHPLSRSSCLLRGAEMLQARHHLVLEQRERVVPSFGLVLVVEAEHAAARRSRRPRRRSFRSSRRRSRASRRSSSAWRNIRR